MIAGERRQSAQFAMPLQQALMMLVIVGLVIAGSYTAYGFVEPIFLANRYLNGVILGVFFIGILACFWQVAQIVASVVWIESFLNQVKNDGALSLLTNKPPRLLAPLAGMLGTNARLSQISTASARSILDTVASRMDEARDITRYLSNLLIFLGLLGTFFGLAITIPAIVETIRALAPSSEEGGVMVFTRLMSGLEAQLGGMGTAFSSSLLGLAGSLVVGLLDLLAGHGQNRFYRELENWISGITRVGFGQSLIDAEGGDRPLSETAISALLEHLTVLHETLTRVEEERTVMVQGMTELVQAVQGLTEKVEGQTELQEVQLNSGPPVSELVKQLADRQDEIVNLIGKLSVDLSDEETRMSLRSIDTQLLKIGHQNQVAGHDLVVQLKQDLGSLTAAIRGLTHQTPSRTQEHQHVPDTNGTKE